MNRGLGRRVEHQKRLSVLVRVRKEDHAKKRQGSPPKKYTKTMMGIGSFVPIYAIVDVTVNRVTTSKENFPAADIISVFYRQK
jgi:hypothetical protein